MPLSSQPLVRGFLGENRLAPDDLLPDNVSPDAQNVDYSSGSIKKRKGFTKIHQDAIYSGGVHIDNVSNNRGVVIPDASQLDLAGDFTIEMFFTLIDEVSTNEPIMTKFDSATTSGWIFLIVGTGSIRFRKYDSGGVLRDGTITSSDFIPLQAGERYHLIGARTGTTMRIRIARLSDGTAATAVVTCSGDTNNTRDLYIGPESGASPGAADIDYIVDELRLWDTERTDAELTETRYRELNEEEVLNANLVGYWKMNEGAGNIVEDISINANHGSLFESGASPTTVEGLIPQGSEDDFAVRFNGQDQQGTLAYRSDFAPIQDTGNVWTVETWLRLDSAPSDIANSRFLALGDFTPDGTNTGCVFSIYVDASLNLFYSYSTTTTHSNATRDTTYDVIVGQSFHVLLLRDGVDSILTYINGVLLNTLTGVGVENGPTVDADTGLTLGHMLSGGTAGNFCPCTIDEVRLWTKAMDGRYPRNFFDYGGGIPAWLSGPDGPLISQLHFNAGHQTEDEKDVDAAVTFLPADDKPVWSQGLVYPLKPEPLALVAPLTRHLGGEDVSSGQSRPHQEILVATRTDFWTIQGTQRKRLDELVVPNAFDNRYTHSLYRNLLVVMNGLGRNYRYDGKVSPVSLTLPTWTDVVTVIATGAGSGWNGVAGDYKYRFAWYDNVNGIEGLYGGEKTITVAAIHDTVDISDMASSLTDYANVTHVRVYRQDPGSTVFRHLADVAIGTTTYSDDGSSVAGNDAANTRRGHPDPHSICAVYSNRIFLANKSENPSSVTYSDAATEDFPGTNEFKVDDRDGDEVTGMAPMFGGLVIFKQNSIHFLTGSGATTFRLIKVLDGIGCVSHNTIAPAPGGLYFLGEDGVYLFDGRSARYLSHSQQPEFQKLDRALARNGVGAYDISTHQYIVSFDTIEQGSLSYYDIEPELFTHYWKFADLTDEKGVASNFTETGGDAEFIFDAARGTVYNSTGNKELSISDDSLAAQGSTADFTMGCWVNFSAVSVHYTGPVQVLASDGSSIVLAFNNTVIGHAAAQNIAVTGASLGGVPVLAGDWHHWLFTKNANVVRFYLDGKLISQDVATDSTWDQIMADLLVAGAPIIGTWAGMLQNLFIINNGGLVASKVKELYEVEAGIISQRTRQAFSYDEETQAWAKWDKDFDTLVLAEHTSRQNDVLIGRNGFVNKLLHSDRDGAGFILGGPIYGSGSLSSETGPLVTDSNAVFPTAGDGFAGVEFVAVPSDTTLSKQKRTILYNTATVLHLDTPLLPAVSGTYYIGPIDLHWESRWMDMGDPSTVKVFHKLFIWVAEHSATVTFRYKTNQVETWTTGTFSTADEFIFLLETARGRKIKIRFEHLTTDETMNIQSWQNKFDPLPGTPS